MSTTYYNRFQRSLSEAAETKGAINTFREYIDAKITKLSNFICGKGQFASFYIPSSGNNVINKVVRITPEEYEYCMTHEGSVDLPYNDLNDKVTVLCDDVCDSIEESLGELKTQSEFIQYALETEAVEASTFITRVRALSDNIPSYIITKYSQFCSMANSPVEMLSNFFSTIINNKPDYENNYVGLVNPDDYVGNVWESAFLQVWDTVTGFFANIEFDITKLDKFFQDIGNALKSLLKWGFSMLFGNLLTVYEKYSGAVMGLMDFPIFQIDLGDKTQFENWFQNIITNPYSNTRLYSWDHTTFCTKIQMTNPGNSEFRGNLSNYVRYGLQGLVTEEDDDGNKFASTTEIVVNSGEAYDVCLQIGKNTDNHYILSAYIVADYGSWSKYSDDELRDVVYNSLFGALMSISRTCPMINHAQTVDDSSILWHEVTEIFIKYPSSYPDDPLPKLCKLLNYKAYLDETKLNNSQLNSCLVSILTYIVIMSRGSIYWESGQRIDNSNYLYSRWGDGNLHHYTTTEPDIITQLPQESMTSDEILEVINSYKPYVTSKLMPITIHYQSVAEQGREIINAIKAVIVAAVLAYATYKVLKWTKKRKKDTRLAWAQTDQFSWNYANNPTQENLDKFNAAYKKSKHMDIVNNILGFATSATASTAGSTMANTLMSSLSKSTSEGLKRNTTDLSDIKVLITGE